MTGPDDVVVFKSNAKATAVSRFDLRSGAMLAVMRLLAIVVGFAFAVFIVGFTLVWLILPFLAVSLAFATAEPMGNRIVGSLMFAGSFVLGFRLFPPFWFDYVMLLEARFVIDPSQREVRWEADYRQGWQRRRHLSFAAITGVVVRELYGAETGSFFGVALETTGGNWRQWRRVSVHDTSPQAEAEASRLRTTLLAAGWRAPRQTSPGPRQDA